MKTNPLALILLLTLSFPLWAQTSIEAQNLLEQASKQMESYDSIKFKFSYVLNNRVEQINQESKGAVTVAGDKYRLNFLDAIQLFDGEKRYTIVPENEEVTITQPDEEDDFGINPKELLRFYKKGYDYRWDIAQNVKGKNIQFVKLIPTEDDGEIKSLLVGINTALNHIYKLIEVGTNGTVTTLTINSMVVNDSLASDLFVFNASEYPNYYIND